MQLSNRDQLYLQIRKCLKDLNNDDWQNDTVTNTTWLWGSSFPVLDLDLLHCSLSTSLRNITLSPTTLLSCRVLVPAALPCRPQGSGVALCWLDLS